MKKLIAALVVTFLFPVAAFAGDYYVAQNVVGSGNGSSCLNADNISDLTWGSSGMVDDDDTLHICGTITSTLTIGDSGSSGHPITVVFESGAKLSKAAWGTGSSAAIYGSNKDYIVIDGGTNGIVENTDNGTGLGTQQDSNGVYLTSCDNIEIKNLTIQNIYNRTADSNDSNRYGRSIIAISCAALSIHDCVLTQAEYLLYCYTSANISGLYIYNNTLSRCATAIVVALTAAVDYADVYIYGNEISEIYYWDGCWGSCTLSNEWHHCDGIHTWGNYAGHTVGPIYIYNNYFYGDWGAHVSGWIYLTDYTTPSYIYNNVIVNTAEKAALGFIVVSSIDENATSTITNNTIISTGTGNTSGTGIDLRLVDATIYNNIFQSLYVGIYRESGNPIVTCDNNDFYNVGSVAYSSGFISTLASWRTVLGGCPGTGNECSSITDNPSLSAAYKPDSESDPIVEAGSASALQSATDASGVTWRSTPSIGAYEYDAGDTTPPTIKSKGLKFKVGFN